MAYRDDSDSIPSSETPYQWSSAETSVTFTTMDIDEQPSAPATLLSYEEVKPQSFQGRRKSSRVQQYRRKLRKQRNRRIAFMIASIATSVSLGLAYKIHHPEFTFQQFVPVDDLNVTSLDQLLDAAGNRTQQVVRKLTGAIEEEPKEDPKKKKKKRVEKKLEPPEVKEEPPKMVENPKPKPIEPEKPTMQVAVVEEEPEPFAIALNPRRERRPILCNIPLTYLVNRRCRRLARENPLFNLQNLVQNMMQ